jgi:hypothetical protein
VVAVSTSTAEAMQEVAAPELGVSPFHVVARGAPPMWVLPGQPALLVAGDAAPQQGWRSRVMATLDDSGAEMRQDLFAGMLEQSHGSGYSPITWMEGRFPDAAIASLNWLSEATMARPARVYRFDQGRWVDALGTKKVIHRSFRVFGRFADGSVLAGTSGHESLDFGAAQHLDRSKHPAIAFHWAGPSRRPLPVPTAAAAADRCATELVSVDGAATSPAGELFVLGARCPAEGSDDDEPTEIVSEHFGPDGRSVGIFPLPPAPDGSLLALERFNALTNDFFFLPLAFVRLPEGDLVAAGASKGDQPYMARFAGGAWQPMQGPPGSPVLTLAVRGDGVLWASTEAGRVYFRDDRGAWQRVGLPEGVRSVEVQPPPMQASRPKVIAGTRVLAGLGDDLWVITENAILRNRAVDRVLELSLGPEPYGEPKPYSPDCPTPFVTLGAHSSPALDRALAAKDWTKAEALTQQIEQRRVRELQRLVRGAAGLERAVFVRTGAPSDGLGAMVPDERAAKRVIDLTRGRLTPDPKLVCWRSYAVSDLPP